MAVNARPDVITLREAEEEEVRRPIAIFINCRQCHTRYEECAYDGPCRFCARGHYKPARCPYCGVTVQEGR